MKKLKKFYVFFDGSFEVEAFDEAEALELGYAHLDDNSMTTLNFDFDSIEVEEGDDDEDDD